MLRWFREQGRSFPWRESQDPYAVLISHVLLQRTRGGHAVRVYDKFLAKWPTPDSLGKAREESIVAIIRPLGLVKRARLLRHLGLALEEAGGVPRSLAGLMALPGVGPYAAHAVLVFALRRNLPLVDWVIARVLQRYFGLRDDQRPNADPDLWDLAAELARTGRARELWLGTLDFASAVCAPDPRCPSCPLKKSCSYARDQRIQ